VTNKQYNNNNSHENQDIFILMIKKARTRPKLLLKIKKKTSRQGLSKPGRRNKHRRDKLEQGNNKHKQYEQK
jgi:hypothetical protein